MSEPVPGLPGNELVFRRSRSSRKYLLTRAVSALILAGIVAAVGVSLQPHILVIAAYLIGLVAVGNAAAYAVQGLVRTALTNEGIEVRGYVRRVIPWSEVRAFRVRGLDQPELLAPDPGSASQAEPRRLVASSRMSRMPEWDRQADRSRRARSRRVRVEVMRTTGRPVTLPAPIVAGPEGDPDFPDKVRQLEQWRQQCTGQQSAPLF
jgi:hypothetical protein